MTSLYKVILSYVYLVVKIIPVAKDHIETPKFLKAQFEHKVIKIMKQN
jgi:hypothetical protein